MVFYNKFEIACPSTLVSSIPESSPVKIWSGKSLPGEKCLHFFTFRKLLHDFLYPGKNTESLLIFELLPDEL